MKFFAKLLLTVGIGLLIAGIPTMISCIKNRKQASFTFSEYEEARPGNHWLKLTECRFDLDEAFTFKSFGKGKSTFTYLPIRGEESSPSDPIVAFLAIETDSIAEEDLPGPGPEAREISGMVRVGFRKDDFAAHELSTKFSVADGFVVLEEGIKPNWWVAILWPIGFLFIGISIRIFRPGSGRKGKIGESGAFKNFSQASSATNFYPNWLRLLWYELRILPQIILWASFLGILFIGAGIVLGGTSKVFLILGWLLGGIALLVALAGVGLALYAKNPMRENFKNGLLTAGIIEDRKTHTVLHIANLSCGGPPENYVYGIRRIRHDGFPYPSLGKTKQIACVSGFTESSAQDGSWGNFIPTPVAFGTSNRKRIQQCLQVVSTSEDGNYFEILRLFLSKRTIAPDSLDLYVCDQNGDLLEIRKLSGNTVEESNRPTPPPIPGSA